MERLHVDGRLRGSVAATVTEHIGGSFLELRLPRCDLIGVHIELLRQLSQCSIALDGCKRPGESGEENHAATRLAR